MKIICDSCGAKYSIPDEKVQGKIFKIRCKRCSEVIVVKGSDSGGGSDYGSAYGNTGGVAEWYVVIDGERVGPITPEEVEAYYTAGQLHSETFVWRDGLDDWVMLNTLSEFAHLMHDSAGPDDATMVAMRTPDGGYEPVQTGYSSESGGYGDYSGYGGGYDEDDGDSTMVMDASKFEQQDAGYFGSEPVAAAAVESGSYGTVDSGGYDAGAASSQDFSSDFSSGSGYDSGGSYDAGGYDSGGGYDDAGYDSGGYEEEGGGGMFAAFDSSSSDYSEEPAESAAPDLSSSSSSEGMVGARNENSVLFSLSSVDQVRAVSAADAPGAGQAEGSDKSGLIDIQALASSHAAMAGRKSKDDDDDAFVAGTMGMPALMPMGTKKSNTGLIVGISVGAAVLVVGLIGVIAFLVMGDSKEEAAPTQAVAVAQPEESEKEEPLSEEEAAEAEAAKAAAQAALEGKGASDEDEGEEEQAAEEKEEEKKEERKAVAQRDTSGSKGSGSSSGRSGSRTPAAASRPAAPKKSSGSDVDDILGQIGGSKPPASQRPSSPPAAQQRPSTPPAQQQARQDLPDSLSRSMVQRTIRRYTAQINACATNSNPDKLTGTPTVRFVVEGNGSVSTAQIGGEFRGTPVGNCIEGVVKGMRFPETRDDSRTINYPFPVR